MDNPESFLENETHKRPWDLKIQTDYLISARRSDLITINKKENLQNYGTSWLGWPQSKIEKKQKREVHRPCQGIEKTMEHENDIYINYN